MRTWYDQIKITLIDLHVDTNQGNKPNSSFGLIVIFGPM